METQRSWGHSPWATVEWRVGTSSPGTHTSGHFFLIISHFLNMRKHKMDIRCFNTFLLAYWTRPTSCNLSYQKADSKSFISNSTCQNAVQKIARRWDTALCIGLQKILETNYFWEVSWEHLLSQPQRAGPRGDGVKQRRWRNWGWGVSNARLQCWRI